MSVQVSYKKQFLFGIMFLLIILIVVEGSAKIWWYQLESCAFEDSDVYDMINRGKSRGVFLLQSPAQLKMGQRLM